MKTIIGKPEAVAAPNQVIDGISRDPLWGFKYFLIKTELSNFVYPVRYRVYNFFTY
ncbi:hypothetical protein [Arachidicoccus terrestris]|uniref:hypothetical protein n=1 Tax=Arachidicoccus terrestris TaxID=2875539 RepID=UPI001CC443D9|nr:hypothetical protein [Arachidicoccus terrestris]UAY53932.1 hypothetical protein K9M52_10620 [Arachidicoccus terrestris]